jgi:hypothetical protein
MMVDLMPDWTNLRPTAGSNATLTGYFLTNWFMDLVGKQYP